jgi:hypothetical protein
MKMLVIGSIGIPEIESMPTFGRGPFIPFRIAPVIGARNVWLVGSIEMELADVSQAVPLCMQDVGPAGVALPQLDPIFARLGGAVGDDPVGGRIHPGHHLGPERTGNRRVGCRLSQNQTLRGKPVDMGRHHGFVPKETLAVGSHLVGKYEYQVGMHGFSVGHDGLRSQQGEEGGGEVEFHALKFSG